MHLPLSIADPTGALKKAQKSLLLHKIEGDVEPFPVINTDHAFIADAMAFVRQVRVNDLSYSQFAESLLSYIVGCAKKVTQIDVIFDLYKENSIKDVERARRSTCSVTLKRIIPSSPIKQWGDLFIIWLI